MYGGPKVLALPATGAAIIMPRTGAFKPLFFMAVAMAAFGVLSLAASGVFALKRRMGSN